MEGKQQEESKKWKNKVMGDESDIKQAIKRLNRPPVDAAELQREIGRIRKQELEETARDSKHSFY
jgi:hypothetical protein